MKKIILALVTVFLVFALTGCATMDPVTKAMNNMEGTARKINNGGGFAVVGLGQSKDLSMAREKAIMNAQRLLAETMSTKIEALKKSFSEEVGEEMNDFFSIVSKSKTIQELRGARQINSDIMTVNKEITYFVIMELSPEIILKSIEDEINREKALYNRYQATKAFDELKQEVDDYNEYKLENDKLFLGE